MLWLSWLSLNGGAFPRCVCVPSPDSAVPWLQDPLGNWFLLDTGSPLTRVTPAAALELEQMVVVTEALPESLRHPEVEGLLGADVLLAQPWWRDGEQVYFGEPPEGLALLASLPLQLAGGGTTCLEGGQCHDFGPTRLLAQLELDGQPLTLLLDTGATYVTLGSHLGWTQDTLDTRVGDLELHDIPLQLADELLDEDLRRLSEEVGLPVDGLLGQSLLTGFVVGVSDTELTLSVYE